MTDRVPEERAQRTRGVLVVVLGIIALGALILFTRRPMFFGRQHEYSARFGNVAGLNVGDEVRWGGLRVGSVTSLAIDSGPPAGIRVGFRVRRNTPVRAGTRASIAQIGLLGQPYLALAPSAGSGPLLADGASLPADENLGLQDALRRFGAALDRADSVFASVERLTTANPLARLDTTLARADTLVRGASAGSSRLLAQLDAATQQLATLLARSERLVGSIDTAVAEARPGLSATQREALETLRETRALVSELRQGLGEGEGLTQLVRNLNSASENFARLSARLERDPSSLLKRRDNPVKPSGPPIRE